MIWAVSILKIDFTSFYVKHISCTFLHWISKSITEFQRVFLRFYFVSGVEIKNKENVMPVYMLFSSKRFDESRCFLAFPRGIIPQNFRSLWFAVSEELGNIQTDTHTNSLTHWQTGAFIVIRWYIILYLLYY